MPRPKGYSPNKAKDENLDDVNNSEIEEKEVETTNTEEPCPAEKEKEKEKSSDRVNELLLKKLEELEGKIAELESRPTSTQSEKEYKFGSVKSKNIPKSDKLDKPHTFVMMGRGYVLSVYNFEGSEVLAPYGIPVYFKWKNSDKRKTSEGEQAIHYSTYSTWSKKECEFVKNSPFFGTLIFDKVTDLEEVNPELVSTIERASTYVANMTQDEIFGLAGNYKLDINLPVSKLKSMLIAIKVQEIIAHDDGLYKSFVAKSGLVNEFIR